MATKNTRPPVTKRTSKRQRRIKVIVYIMIIAMVLSTLTAGLAYFI